MDKLEQHAAGTLDWAQHLAPAHGFAPAGPPASSSTSTKRPHSPPQGQGPPLLPSAGHELHAADADADGEPDLSLPDLPAELLARPGGDDNNTADLDHLLVLPTPPAHLFGQADTGSSAIASTSRVDEQQQQQNAVAGPSSGAGGAGPAAGGAQDEAQGGGDVEEEEEPVADGPEAMPDRDAFEAAVEEYLQSLHAIKRSKALMSDPLHHLVLSILREPQNTKQGDPQMRFWVRQRFTLLAAPDGDFVVHEDKKVVLRSHLFDTISAAHVAAKHGGRDKTYAEVRKLWSYVPKEVVVVFIRLCPTCGGKRKTVKGKRPQGDKRIPLPKEVRNARARGDDAVPGYTRILPKPAPPSITAQSAIAATTGDFELDPALLAASSSSPAHAPLPVAGPSNAAFLPSSLLPALLPRPPLPPAPPSSVHPDERDPKRQRTGPADKPEPKSKSKAAVRPRQQRTFKHAQPGAHPAPAFAPQRSAADLASPAALEGGEEEERPRRAVGRRSARAAAAGISALAALEQGGAAGADEDEDEHGARARATMEELGLVGGDDEDAPGEEDLGEEDVDDVRLVIDPELLGGDEIQVGGGHGRSRGARGGGGGP
ncbi:hypothetical protein JCM9279_003362 [Rhodotorula babjevae]